MSFKAEVSQMKYISFEVMSHTVLPKSGDPIVIHDRTACVYVKFEVFTAVTMKNGVFWVVTPCGSCTNRRFGETWRLLHQGDKNR
jgi:hypothetical protein